MAYTPGTLVEYITSKGYSKRAIVINTPDASIFGKEGDKGFTKRNVPDGHVLVLVHSPRTGEIYPRVVATEETAAAAGDNFLVNGQLVHYVREVQEDSFDLKDPVKDTESQVYVAFTITADDEEDDDDFEL